MTYFQAELNEAQEAIQRVRELHKASANGLVCVHCLDYDNEDAAYRCPTIRALDGDTDTLEREDDHDSRNDWHRDEDLG